MTFQVHKMHKLQDQMESLAHEWVWTDISEYYKVEEIEDLNQEQVDELYAYAESEDCYDDDPLPWVHEARFFKNSLAEDAVKKRTDFAKYMWGLPITA